MNQIDVKTHGDPYPILIGEALIDETGARIRALMKSPTQVAVVTNPTVGGYYADRVMRSLEGAGLKAHVAEVPDGEQYKTLDTIRTLYDRFLDMGLDRRGLVLALGGGVVGDMAGFAAATYLRGTPVVQTPTTLLAMVDASVGGKTGVDMPQGKNLVGAFKQPRMVLIDPAVLSTLDRDELASGMAEVLKHGLIGDAALFEQLEEETPRDFTSLVDKAVRVKVAVVERDPFEKGERALLNLGHTFGHAFELVSEFKIRHGEAVAVGLAAAAKLAADLGECDPTLIDRVEKALETQDLPNRFKGHSVREIVNAMKHDKKRAGQKLRFVISTAPGNAKILEDPPITAIEDAVEWVTGQFHLIRS